MCLISICPKGTEKDSKRVLDFLREGASSNTHGSGFAYKKNKSNKITISKGYFDIEKLIEDLLVLKLDKEDEVIFHHRIGTSGGQTRENTHPFVVSTDDEETKKLDVVTDKPVLVHNGIFSGLTTYEMQDLTMSDTYAFARHIMSNNNVMEIFKTDGQLFEVLLNNIIGNDKLCFLFPDRDLKTYGKFIEDEGYLHSNRGYYTYVRNVGGTEDAMDFDIIDVHNSHFLNNSRFGSATGRPSNDEFLDKSTKDLVLSYKADKNISKLVLLTNRYVNLNKDNYHHFRYIRKKDWDTLVNKKDAILMDIVNFDITESIQNTVVPISTGVTRLGTITTLQLVNNCYFIPKGTYWSAIHTDYKYLYDRDIRPSKSSIKDLTTTLVRNFKKTAQDKIYYKKTSSYVCRKALEMHLVDMKDIYDGSKTTIVEDILEIMKN